MSLPASLSSSQMEYRREPSGDASSSIQVYSAGNGEHASATGAAALAAFGVSLVNFASQGTVDAQVGLTFGTLLFAFGGVFVATRRFASEAVPHLLPPVAVIAGFGFIEIFRLNPYRAGLQRWWLLIGAALATVGNFRNRRLWLGLFLAAMVAGGVAAYGVVGGWGDDQGR